MVVRSVSDELSRHLFLLERVHIVRAPFIDRFKDPVWVIGAVLTVIVWAAIIAHEYIAPRSELSRLDGIYRIGIRPDSAIFIWQLRPALCSIVHRESSGSSRFSARISTRLLSELFRRVAGGDRFAARVDCTRTFKAMLLRNVVGSCLLLCAQIANNFLSLTWPFATHSHVCQLMCLTDSELRSSTLKRHTDAYSCVEYASNKMADRTLNHGKD